MKAVLTTTLIFFSLSSLASTYRLKDSLCGEVDPFVIGDACVVVLENKKEELVVITSDELELEIGSFIEINKSELTPTTKDEAREYRAVVARHLSIRRGAKFFTLENHLALVETNLQLISKNFSCEAQGSSSNGYLDANISFSGTLSNANEFSQMTNIQFKYAFVDGDRTWSQGQSLIAKINNSVSYRPQVYVAHEKFSYFYSGRGINDGFGLFDFILPTKEIMAGKKKFTAHVIMTSIDDHHGDTATVKCIVD